MRFSSKWTYTIVVALAPLLLLGIASLFSPVFSYNRWDNFEFMTPVFTAAHFQWLEGNLPQWNQHAFMGEPLLGTMASGVFYLPYTLCCLWIKVFGLSRSAFPLLNVLLHSAIAMIGWRLLFGRLGVRPLIALLLGAGYVLGGFWTDITAVWGFTAPHMAWLPWILYAVIRFVDHPTRRNAALLTAMLAVEMYIGYVQFSVYAWIFAGVFTTAYLVVVHRSRKALIGLAVVVAIAVLACGPFLVPAYSYATGTGRIQGVSQLEFLDRSAAPESAMDILLPVYLYDNGFMKGKASIYLHQGAWIAPPILAAALLWWRRRRSADSREIRLWRVFWAAGPCALFFYVLAIGSHGYLLAPTWHIPVWASFRWPFKFIPFCLPFLVLASGIGLELCWTEERQKKLLWTISAAVPVLAILLLVINTLSRKTSIDPLLAANPLNYRSAMVCLIAGLAAMALVLHARRKWAIAILLSAASLELIAFLTFGHSHELWYKTYREQEVGPQQLGIDVNYRVLPVSSFNYDPNVIAGEYASFSSPTMYGYDGATGCQTAGLLPTHYSQWFSLFIDGVPGPATLPLLLGSSLLRSFNVGYVVVGKDDVAKLRLIQSKPGYTLKKELGRTFVYEDSGAMPRVYFATRVLKQPRDYSRAVVTRLLWGYDPPTTAIVDTSGLGPDPTAPEEVAPAHVISADWRNGTIRAQVNASGNSFMIISENYSEGWRAWVDGVAEDVHLVNGTIMGIDVPLGVHDIRLSFLTPGLWTGGFMALLGVALLAAWRFEKAEKTKKTANKAEQPASAPAVRSRRAARNKMAAPSRRSLS